MEWIAATPWMQKGPLGRLSMTGGKLRLEPDALVFEPLAGLGRTKRIALDDVADVEPLADKPPRLRIQRRDGKSLTLIVVPKRATSIASTDTTARDDAVAAIANARR